MIRNEFNPIARSTVLDTLGSYRLTANDFTAMAAYDTPGDSEIFRPFEAGKASPEELQDELDRILVADAARGKDTGIRSVMALRMAMLRRGIGIDCSNLAVRTQIALHQKIGEDYGDHLFFTGTELLKLHEQRPQSWSPRTPDEKNDKGEAAIREFTTEELEMLQSGNVSASWVMRVFGKTGLWWITSANRMTSPEHNTVVAPEDTAPGDMIAFTKPDLPDMVSHVGVVYETARSNFGRSIIRFAHSWNVDDVMKNGPTEDEVTHNTDSGRFKWSHPDLANPNRYGGHFFVRPRAFVDKVQNG